MHLFETHLKKFHLRKMITAVLLLRPRVRDVMVPMVLTALAKTQMEDLRIKDRSLHILVAPSVRAG